MASSEPNVETKHDNDDAQTTQTAVVHTENNTDTNDWKRNEEKKKEEEYNKIVNENEMNAPRDQHVELSYRPYKYISTPVTRPNMKNHSDGNAILYTAYDDEHKFNYFRYWIGRTQDTEFRDDAENITHALKTVILRDEYDSDNMREDMMVEEDDNESMILNEEEFETYQWTQNTTKQNKFRNICCHVIDILPLYQEWIHELAQHKSTDDLSSIHKCGSLPCAALKRLMIALKFYNQWMRNNFNDALKPKHKFHFAVHDFMNCLEHYNKVEFTNDCQHLKNYHIDPTKDRAIATKQSDVIPFGDDSDLDADNESDDDTKEKVEDVQNVILDSENRNVYEWFEDLLGECDVEKCAVFERFFRSRYEAQFNTKHHQYYALNGKESNDWLERVEELQYQRELDAAHMTLFHTSARFDCMGLGDSEEHRKFLSLSLQKQKEVKSTNKY